MKSRKIRISLKSVLIVLLIVAIGYLVKMSIDEYKSQAEAMGIVVCSEEGCIKTMHIHSDVEFDLCGQSLTLPRETGPLSGLHTHKEKNYLHFHDEVQLNSDTKEQLFEKRLSIQELLEIFQIEAGDYCGDSEVKTRVIVNDLEPEDGLEYNWKDGDNIKLIFEAQ
ncbi:MAG: hypothetical protein OEY44_00670 [Candidatus Peregrinibacteria bacterium]|nr:hypothetical protein [Candidatus Peregrinibacteria bacterium]